jgi:hypothetical protein
MDLTDISAGFRIVPFVCKQRSGTPECIRFSGTSIYYMPQGSTIVLVGFMKASSQWGSMLIRD